MTEFEFENYEDAKHRLAGLLYKYRFSEEDTEFVMDATNHINRCKLREVIEEKIEKCEGKSFTSYYTHDEDKNEGWIEALEWFMELTV